MDEQLYVVICEINNKKHIKRIFKNPDDCYHYLDELHNEVRSDKHGIYSLIRYTDEELIIEEIQEGGLGEHIQRKYSILSGNVDTVLTLMSQIFNEK